MPSGAETLNARSSLYHLLKLAALAMPPVSVTPETFEPWMSPSDAL